MLQHKFVEFIPEHVEEGILYISIEYCTAIHKCVCGCGNEVVTPLSPTDWELSFDGKTVSLYPSIGNWNFACRSHYWISKSNIEYADRWTTRKIKEGRKSASDAKEKYYSDGEEHTLTTLEKKRGFWSRIFGF
ncbi:DUF6527 family protein [[Flexibacter] sp. ATCC 35208]|uniref:DUF6527 family protein n=1 Tax=[Flexibacter] sp. ATCC 35208 TaxID=1936242 RepID=UPI001F169FEF|nr:DUF6527 family protein [[Flexibacter] sp. ATCC 35208]